MRCHDPALTFCINLQILDYYRSSKTVVEKFECYYTVVQCTKQEVNMIDDAVLLGPIYDFLAVINSV